MAKVSKYKGRKCILKGVHKKGHHYDASHVSPYIGKIGTVGSYFKWLPDQGCFIGDLHIGGTLLFAKVFITWIKES